MKKIIILLSIALGCSAAMSSFYGCGGGNNSDYDSIEADGDRSDTDPVDYLNGENRLTAKQLDSLATYEADFLSPGQGVGVLCYISQSIDRSSGRTRMEKMVAFRDLYNILASNYGNAFQTSLSKLNSQKGIDLKAIYQKIADRFEGYDDTPGAISVEESRIDTTATDSIAAPSVAAPQ